MADFKGGKLLAVIGDEVGVASCAVESAAGQQQLEIAAQLRSIFRDIYTVSLSQDTCTGFLLGGVGEMDSKRQPNFLVVNKGAHIYI